MQLRERADFVSIESTESIQLSKVWNCFKAWLDSLENDTAEVNTEA